jgi:L-lactate dehydrogenase complex protein LldG
MRRDAGMGDRAAFLERVRSQLAGGLPDNPLRPVTGLGEPVPAVTYALDTSDPVARFVEAARGAAAEVHDGVDAGALLARICARTQARSAVVSRDPECDGVTEMLADLGVAVVDPTDRAAVAAADLGVTGAAYGIALTGSLVVDSARAGGRSASLLPPVHLALLDRSRILPDAGALLRHLPERLPGGLPSNLVLITGPSRSADIELQLTVGVHGPRELVIGLR